MTNLASAQFARYVLVGLAVNAAAYAIYLLLTWRVMSSETAMTLLFAIGTLLGFLGHRSITFRHRGHHVSALQRYLLCYGALYVLNLLALQFFAERLGFPHQLVQGCAIPLIALLAFAIQRYWVFPAATDPVAPTAAGGS